MISFPGFLTSVQTCENTTQTQTEDIPQNHWPGLFQSVKVMKDRGTVTDWRRPRKQLLNGVEEPGIEKEQ